MNATRNAIAAILLCAVPVGAALAQARAEASISGFTYILADLDPTDGIAPSLSWNVDAFPSYTSYSYIGYIDGTSGQTRNEQINGAAAMGPTTQSAAYSYNRSLPSHMSATATVSGSSFDTLALHTASETFATANGASTRANADTGLAGFILSPNTAISIFASVVYSSSAVLRDGPVLERAIAGGRLSVWGAPQTPAINDFYNQAGALWPDSGVGQPGWVLPDASDTGTISVTFSNLQAVPAQAYLSVHLAAHSFSETPFTTPVPEPATWGMLLGGLAMLAGLGRRRMRPSAAA